MQPTRASLVLLSTLVAAHSTQTMVRDGCAPSPGRARAVSVSPRPGRRSPLSSGSPRRASTSSPPPLPAYPLAARVAKRFGGIWYEGRVVAYVEPEAHEKDRRRWFRVEYDDDGDAEDMTRREVNEAIDAYKDHARLEDARRSPTYLPPCEPCSDRSDADDRAAEAAAACLYERVDVASLAFLATADIDAARAAKLLLALKPTNVSGCRPAKRPRADSVERPGPRRRRLAASEKSEKADGRPGPPKAARVRKNHQAQTKPPVDADGNYPCQKGCGRTFGHAPASVAHTKACKFVACPC